MALDKSMQTKVACCYHCKFSRAMNDRRMLQCVFFAHGDDWKNTDNSTGPGHLCPFYEEADSTEHLMGGKDWYG
jgi:hypothetical protein